WTMFPRSSASAPGRASSEDYRICAVSARQIPAVPAVDDRRRYVRSCKRPSLEKTAHSCLALEGSILNEHVPPRDDSLRHTPNPAAFISAIVHAHVMRFGADGLLPVRIKDHDVRIRSDGDRS